METLKIDKKGNITATIIDEELDSIECKFNNDGCVELDTEKYAYITLSASNLIALANLIAEADKIYSERTDEEWESFDD